MKNLAILLILLFNTSLIFANNGSFFILKSTYLYQNSNREGKRTLTRTRQAYRVVDIYAPDGNSLMFQVEFNSKHQTLNGSGYIVETESELKELGLSKVKVYIELPSRKSDLAEFQLVPSNQLSFTGRGEESPDFPKLTWKAVNYKIEAPVKVWVPEWAGIYRPDKDADWFNKAYQTAMVKNFDQDLLNKILNGQVETGFTKEQVRMALGVPVKEQPIENNTKTEWIYSGRKVIFIDDIVSRVL